MYNLTILVNLKLCNYHDNPILERSHHSPRKFSHDYLQSISIRTTGNNCFDYPLYKFAFQEFYTNVIL